MSVKKLFLSVAIICSLFGTVQKANAQAAIIALIFGDQVASEKFNLSMELGGNFSQYSDLSNVDQNKYGINFGIAGNLMLNENWYLSPTAYFLSGRSISMDSYNLAATNHTSTNLNNEFDGRSATLDLSYIDVPVLVSYQTNNKKWRFSAGPQISFLTGSDLTINGDYGDLVQDYKSKVNDIDYGVLTSIGYSLGQARKGKGVYIQLRYYQGFSDVFTENPETNKASYFSLHLSLPFITEELAQKNLDAAKK